VLLVTSLDGTSQGHGGLSQCNAGNGQSSQSSYNEMRHLVPFQLDFQISLYKTSISNKTEKFISL
jgi:hypothetical protein